MVNNTNNTNNVNIDQARLISRWLLVSRIVLSIAAVLLLELAAISVGGLIAGLAGVVFVSLIIAFVWAKIEQKSLVAVLNNVQQLNSRVSGSAKFIVVIEALLFFIALYLSVYATLSLFSVASGLSIIISAVAMLPILVLYVSYLQKNNIVDIYSKVNNADTDSNNKSDKPKDLRIPVAGQILVLLLFAGLIVFSFLNPAVFAAITAVVAGSFDLMLVRAALGVLCLLILIYANTPNNEKVAGFLFGGFSLVITIMTGVALVSFFASQGFVLSAAASLVVYFFIGLVAGFYAVLSYDFNCKYDYCYYNSQESQGLDVLNNTGDSPVSAPELGSQAKKDLKSADIHDSVGAGGEDLVDGPAI